MRLVSRVLSELVATIGGVTRMVNKWVDEVRAAIIHITVGLKCVSPSIYNDNNNPVCRVCKKRIII